MSLALERKCRLGSLFLGLTLQSTSVLALIEPLVHSVDRSLFDFAAWNACWANVLNRVAT